jgi:hypothetical protein
MCAAHSVYCTQDVLYEDAACEHLCSGPLHSTARIKNTGRQPAPARLHPLITLYLQALNALSV